jgi:two-component system cell cycle response regulator
MRSLQWKFTLALLATSLTAVLLVGVIARGMLLSKFNQISMERSFEMFHADVQAYIAAHGSWEKAQRAQSFERFSRSKRLAAGQTNEPNAAEFERPGPGQAGLRPPGRGPEGRGTEGRSGEGRRQADFRFVLLDAQRRILMGPPHERGRPAPPDMREQAKPVVVNGQTEAYVVPWGRPNLSPQDREYLGAIQEALVRGFASASLIILALGLFLGRRLSRNLRELASAMREVGQGKLGQQVKVRSRDEVGVVAQAFNRMSADLAQANEQLQQSHQKIHKQTLVLQELSIRDGLTKLYNRRHFDEQVAHALAQAQRYEQPLSVMIGDIDFFKRINDSFSHAVGDKVIQQVAEILRANTRASDIVARYGGEEFVVAFTQTSLGDAHALCEKLRDLIEGHPWHQIHADLRVTISIGLDADTSRGLAESMVGAADRNLYHAKETGRNRVCSSTDLAETMPRSNPSELSVAGEPSSRPLAGSAPTGASRPAFASS